MKVLINAVSTKLGGAATYARNLARSVAEQAAPGEKFLFIVPEERAVDINSELDFLLAEAAVKKIIK